MRLVIGSDHRGRELCGGLRQHLDAIDRFEIDYLEMEGESVDYPDVAARVAATVSDGRADFGILICGTGIGMCIVANKFPGVRAAPCHSELMAEFSRRFVDANILCLPADTLGEQSSRQIVEKWLTTSFEGGRHEKRLEKIKGIERRCLPALPTVLPPRLTGGLDHENRSRFVGPSELRH